MLRQLTAGPPAFTGETLMKLFLPILVALIAVLALFAPPIAAVFAAAAIVYALATGHLPRLSIDMFSRSSGNANFRVNDDAGRPPHYLHNTSIAAMSVPATWPYVRARVNDVFNGLLALIALMTRSRPGYVAA